MKFPIDDNALYNLPQKQVEVDLISSLICLSRGLDCSQQGLMDHHLRVSLLSLYLGQALKLSEDQLFELFKAAIIHDIGAVTLQEKATLFEFDGKSTAVHCHRGYDFVRDLPFFSEAGKIIYSHHDRWNGENPSGLSKDQIPLAGRIIHLADRVDVLLNTKENVISQREGILSELQRFAGEMFDPDLVATLGDIAVTESIWLDLASSWQAARIESLLPNCRRTLGAAELHDLAELYARIVDAKSPFTYMHSRGVAQMAFFLAQQTGMSNQEIFMIHIAGLLHDLGKLTVPEEILSKPGALTRDEMAIVKQHTYYTYWWLKPAFGTMPIAEWGAFHHERLDSKGYPFHKTPQELDLGSRIVAVSDVFTALREERPYRASLSWESIERIMSQQVKGSGIDGAIVDILMQNKALIEDQWQDLADRLKANS